MFDLLSLSIAASHDETAAVLLDATGLDAHSFLSPWGAWGIASDRTLTFTTTVRVVTWVHSRTTDGWADAHMASAAGFAKIDKVPVVIADDADCGAADA